MYYFLANNSESCPELSGERLLTTVAEGESFEGLSVSLIRIERVFLFTGTKSFKYKKVNLGWVGCI